MSDQTFPELGTLDDLAAYALALQAVHGWAADITAQAALETLGLPLRGRGELSDTLWDWLDPTVDTDCGYWSIKRNAGSLDMPRRRQEAEQAFNKWRAARGD